MIKQCPKCQSEMMVDTDLMWKCSKTKCPHRENINFQQIFYVCSECDSRYLYSIYSKNLWDSFLCKCGKALNMKDVKVIM